MATQGGRPCTRLRGGGEGRRPRTHRVDGFSRGPLRAAGRAGVQALLGGVCPWHLHLLLRGKESGWLGLGQAAPPSPPATPAQTPPGKGWQCHGATQTLITQHLPLPRVNGANASEICIKSLTGLEVPAMRMTPNRALPIDTVPGTGEAGTAGHSETGPLAKQLTAVGGPERDQVSSRLPLAGSVGSHRPLALSGP